jgi:deoxyribodipyrimidine photolyase
MSNMQNTVLCSLQVRGSRLIVLRGNPTEVLPKSMKDWAVTKLCFEHDTEPYALKRDAAMKEAAEQAGVEVQSLVPNLLPAHQKTGCPLLCALMLLHIPNT